MSARPYTIRLDPDLIDAIQGEADRCYMSGPEWIRKVLEAAVESRPVDQGWVAVSTSILRQIARRAEQIASAATAQLEGSESSGGGARERETGGKGTGGAAGAESANSLQPARRA